jgi:molecular chaperone GrpE (heat shock protein)
MIVVSEISLYNALRPALGEVQAQTVLQSIKEQVKEEFKNRKDILATKEDITNVRLENKEAKSEIIKWMFGVFAMLMLAVIGLYFKR